MCHQQTLNATTPPLRVICDPVTRLNGAVARVSAAAQQLGPFMQYWIIQEEFESITQETVLLAGNGYKIRDCTIDSMD